MIFVIVNDQSVEICIIFLQIGDKWITATVLKKLADVKVVKNYPSFSGETDGPQLASEKPIRRP
jgi:hypothetical protein